MCLGFTILPQECLLKIGVQILRLKIGVAAAVRDREALEFGARNQRDAAVERANLKQGHTEG